MATASARPADVCANQETAVANESLRHRGRLTGDLEEDGVREEVSVAVDESGEQGCRAFLIAEGEGTVRSTPVAVPDIPFELGFPRLISMPRIDDRRGDEIVLGVAAGASTQFAAIYTADDDALIQVLREGASSPQENLVAFGGSVGHQSGCDCAAEKGPGVIVISEATPSGDGRRFDYVRRFFVPSGPGNYAEAPSMREKGSIRFNRFETLHEFPNAPFGSCSMGG